MQTPRRLLTAAVGCVLLAAFAAPATADCPTAVRLFTHGDSADLDLGWSGLSHDAHPPESIGPLNLALSCPGPEPTCGSCTVSGPIQSAGGTTADNRRCRCDTSVQCTTDSDCPGACPCRFFFGPPMPLSAAGVPVCVTSEITSVAGTVDVDTGSSQTSFSLLWGVSSGPTIDKPCPNCVSGACDAGTRAGLPCTADGTSSLFGDVSYDCPPGGAGIGTLPITMSLGTGTQTRVLSAASPSCRAAGSMSLKCLCDTCNNAAATPCSSNADCAAVGASICGGRRCQGGANNGAPCTVSSECPGTTCGVTGVPTAPNACADATCSPNTPPDNDSCDEGSCAAGPFETFCAIDTFRGCTSNADCPKPGDSCTAGELRECFVDNGAVGAGVQVCGVPGLPDSVLGALFCAAPTTSAAVNLAYGLPGLGRLGLPVTSVLVVPGPTATPTAAPGATETPVPVRTPVLVAPLVCQRAILREPRKFSATKMKALGKCEEGKIKGRLPLGTVCLSEPKTAAVILKAENKLRVGIDRACGGADRVCGGLDDQTPDSIGWPATCPDFEGKGCTNPIDHCGDIATCLVCVNEQAVDQAIALYYHSLSPSAPGDLLQKCQLAIGKYTAKFFTAKTKALTKCFDARYLGKHNNDCPSPGDGKAALKIAKAESKKVASIARACAGFEAAEIGFVSQCPNVDGCRDEITNVSSLIRCVDCVTEWKVDCALPLAVPTLQSYPSDCSEPCDDDIFCTTDELVPFTPEFSIGDTDGAEANAVTCDGGTNAGGPCTSDSQCPGGQCYKPPQELQCVHNPRVGVDYGAWRFVLQCVGGSNAGAACTDTTECPGGSCDSVNVSPCCEDDSDCDDGDPCTEDQCITPTHKCEFAALSAAMCGTAPVPSFVPPSTGPCTPNPPKGVLCDLSCSPSNPIGEQCPPVQTDCLCYSKQQPPNSLVGVACTPATEEEDCGDHAECVCPDGFADVHVHMFAEEMFGGRWVGSNGVDSTVPYCSGGLNYSHGRVWTIAPAVAKLVSCINPTPDLGTILGVVALIGANPGVDFLASLVLSEQFSKVKGSKGDSGFHTKRATQGPGWPRWDVMAHHKVRKGALQAAYNAGMRLIVVTTTGQRALCELLPNAGKGCEEMDDVDRQLQLAHDFDAANSWVTIVRSPQEALKAIEQNRLAMVLAIETTELFAELFPNYPDTITNAPTQAQIGAKLQEYYDKDVRSLQIVHMTDSSFAGAAEPDKVSELLQYMSSPTGPQCNIDFSCGGPVFGFAVHPENDNGVTLCKNDVGLTSPGEMLIQEIMARGMLVDAAHASELTTQRIWELTHANRYYPFYFSHSRFREIVAPDDATENTLPAWIVQRIRRAGGVVGVRPSPSEVRKYTPSPVANDCHGSSRSFAQNYQYGALGLKVPMALGTDLNGFTQHARPRLNDKSLPGKPRQLPNGACAAGFRVEGICQAKDQKTTPLLPNTDLNTKGLAAADLEDDLIDDAALLGANVFRLRHRSALEYIRMWQRAVDQPQRVGPAALANVGTGPTDMDLTGIADFVPHGARELLYPPAPNCFGIRYCANSSSLGEECKFNPECTVGPQGSQLLCGGNLLCGLVTGTCVCDDDNGCPSGQFCRRNIPLIAADNKCHAKRAAGEFCLKKSWCLSNICKITFAKPYPHCG